MKDIAIRPAVVADINRLVAIDLICYRHENKDVTEGLVATREIVIRKKLHEDIQKSMRNEGLSIFVAEKLHPFATPLAWTSLEQKGNQHVLRQTRAIDTVTGNIAAEALEAHIGEQIIENGRAVTKIQMMEATAEIEVLKNTWTKVSANSVEDAVNQINTLKAKRLFA